MLNAENLELHLSYFRGRRNELLAESDWTQLPDAQLSAEQKAQWAAYRQALRDYPSLFAVDSDIPPLPLRPDQVVIEPPVNTEPESN